MSAPLCAARAAARRLRILVAIGLAFDLVSPKGRAPFWNQLGGDNWATAPTYGAGTVARYQEALTYRRLLL